MSAADSLLGKPLHRDRALWDFDWIFFLRRSTDAAF